MAGAAPISQGKGKKPLDVTLNLVPFIDLLSCCIAFLLMVVNFNELKQLEIAQRNPSSQKEKTEKKQEPTLAKVHLFMKKKDGYSLYVEPSSPASDKKKSESKTTSIPLLPSGEFDTAKLLLELKEVKAKYPETNEITLFPENDIAHGKIISDGMDICRSADPSNTSSPLFQLVSLDSKEG